MGRFTIEFDALPIPVGPTYETHGVSVDSTCFDDARYHPLAFNDNITGDYVIGWNWDNPSGFPPSTVQILSFSDKTQIIEISMSTVIPNTYPENTLKDISTGLDLVYPYTINISDIGNIRENYTQTEIECYNRGSHKYKNTRTRIIEYSITDSNGNIGPIRLATYQNIAP